MQPEEHTVTHTINRYRSFRYELILEGVVVGAWQAPWWWPSAISSVPRIYC